MNVPGFILWLMFYLDFGPSVIRAIDWKIFFSYNLCIFELDIKAYLLHKWVRFLICAGVIIWCWNYFSLWSLCKVHRLISLTPSLVAWVFCKNFFGTVNLVQTEINVSKSILSVNFYFFVCISLLWAVFLVYFGKEIFMIIVISLYILAFNSVRYLCFYL